MNAFLGDVNEDTILDDEDDEAMDRSCGSFDGGSALALAAARDVLGAADALGSADSDDDAEVAVDEVDLLARPSLVDSAAVIPPAPAPELAVAMSGCLGAPNMSPRSALGCSRCGWSAKGSASWMEDANGSGGGQPKHSVESASIIEDIKE